MQSKQHALFLRSIFRLGLQLQIEVTQLVHLEATGLVLLVIEGVQFVHGQHVDAVAGDGTQRSSARSKLPSDISAPMTKSVFIFIPSY